MQSIPMDRNIIHINVADFAVAVERRMDPRLVGRPVVIAPVGTARATVYDMSEEAYGAGVRKGMPLRRALRLERRLTVRPPQPNRYEQAMTELLHQALPYSPLIEQGERDGHLFVDVTGTSRLFGPPVDVAWRLGRQARNALGLDPIWALAANKRVAKVASRLVKPRGELIVAPGDEAALLAPLPLWLIPGIDTIDLQRLRPLNLDRVHQVTALDPTHLEVVLGHRTDMVLEALRGDDRSPVLPVGQTPPQVVLDHTFDTDTHATEALHAALHALVAVAGRRLRRQGRMARRIGIIAEHNDGRRSIRQLRIEPPSANDFVLRPLARHALKLTTTRRTRVRHIRLICDRLIYPPAQLPLFETEYRATLKQERLVATLDRIRIRFGTQAIHNGHPPPIRQPNSPMAAWQKGTKTTNNGTT